MNPVPPSPSSHARRRRARSSSPAARGCWPPPSPPVRPAPTARSAGSRSAGWPRRSRPSTSSRTSRSPPRPRSNSTRATRPPRDNFGPTGTATASSLYPGQVVANAGPELPLLVPGAPLPPPLSGPSRPPASIPQAPNSGSTDQPCVNMDTSSTANGNTASATLGDDASTAGSNGADPTAQAPSGSGNPLAGSSGHHRDRQHVGHLVLDAPSTTATAQASATDTGISILGGFITIGSVTSTATATSDGTTGKVTGTTQVQNMDILRASRSASTPTALPQRARVPRRRCRSRRSTRT